MERRKNITMRIKPDVYFYDRQVAELNNRAFSNLVETLLLQEIEKARAEGFEFKKYVPEGGEIEGNSGGKDAELDDEFKRFSKE